MRGVLALIKTVTLPDPDDFTSSGGSNGPLTSPVTSYAYSAAGDLASVTDPRGYVTAYVYDALHRTTREIKDNATLQAKTRYFYDTLGNLSRVQDPELRNVTYEYDALRRTTKKTVDPINWNDGTVIWRKLSFCTQSANGSRFVETMLTVIETCRQQHRNAFQYLTAAVQAHLADQRVPSLLSGA